MSSKTRRLSIVAILAALAIILSVPPIAVPIPLGGTSGSIHFTQLPIFISGILFGPLAGIFTGAVGGILMGFVVGAQIPFIVGGLALLGFASAIFARKARPFVAGIMAWLVQAPYVAVTDYFWFTFSRQMSSQLALATVLTILVTLTIEALISSALAQIIIVYLRKAKIAL